MASRITKSSIDWVKFAELVPKNQTKEFNLFKARSSAYLMQVQSNPETPPAIDFDAYKKTCSNKDAIDKLKAAYASFKVPYPSHNLKPVVDQQEQKAKADAKRFAELTQVQVNEAEEYKRKFESMIPPTSMTLEEFYLTFPDWAHFNRAKPTIWPHDPRQPGLTRQQREAIEYEEYHDFSKDK